MLKTSVEENYVVKPYPENLLLVVLRNIDVIPDEDEMFDVIHNFKNILNALPKIEQNILKLYYAEHKSCYQISRTMGYPEDIIKMKISRFLLRCQQEWRSTILNTKKRENDAKIEAHRKYLQNIKIADYPLRNYNISPKAIHALERRNIWGLEQIPSLKHIAMLPNIGPKSIVEIQLAMETAGLSFQ